MLAILELVSSSLVKKIKLNRFPAPTELARKTVKITRVSLINEQYSFQHVILFTYGVTTYQLDKNGLEIAEINEVTQKSSSETKTSRTEFHYQSDDNGRVIEKHWVENGVNRTSRFEYDEHGNNTHVFNVQADGTAELEIEYVYALKSTNDTLLPPISNTTPTAGNDIETLAPEASTQTTIESPKYASVRTAELNVRSSPNISAEKVGTLYYGNHVAIFETTNDGWGQIAEGWIFLDYVQFDDDSASHMDEVYDATSHVKLTGKIRDGGIFGCNLMVLGKSIAFQTNNSGPIVTNTIGFCDEDSSKLADYVGTIVVVEGDLFNYRDGGDIYFNQVSITTESGKPLESIKKHPDWASIDNETRLWNATEILKKIVMKNTGAWDARVLIEQSALDSFQSESKDAVEVSLAINDSWVSDYDIIVRILPMEQAIQIEIDNLNTQVGDVWQYDWNGNCIFGFQMPIDQYLSTLGEK